MHIGLLAPPWVPIPPPAYGGIELMLDRLARGLVAAGHDVTLFTTADSTCPVPRRWLLEGADTLRMGMAVPELRQVIAGYEALTDCDVVHDHTVAGPFHAARHPHLAVVTTNHSPFNEEMNDLYRAVSDRVPVIAISHAQASEAQGVQIAGVVHHGLDVEAFPLGDGEGGYFLAPPAFLEGLRAICDEHGILLIADEIQTGMGRTGKWWAMEHYGVEPDVVCAAKGIASGMPLGALWRSQAISKL
jgi:hypothetical protein